MDRFVCPPWYECSCPLGLPVSRNTMLNHRRIANERRVNLGRGRFGWGPRFVQGVNGLHVFTQLDDLKDHETDCEDDVNVSRSIPVPTNLVADQVVHAQCHAQTSITNDVSPRNANDSVPGTSIISQPPTSSDGAHVVYDASTQQQAPEIGNSRMVTDDDHEHNDCEVETDASDDIRESPAEVSLITMDATTSIEGLRRWLVGHKNVVDLYLNHGLEQTVMDDILALVGAPCKSWKTVISYISRASTLDQYVQTYPVCPGHFCFAPAADSDPMSCSVCGEPRPSSLPLFSDQRVSYLPIMPRIAEIARDQGRCNQFYEYGTRRQEVDGVFADAFDINVFRRLVGAYSENDLRWDVFMAVSAGGFQPFRNKRHDVWSMIGILYNLPPESRYATKNLLPLMYIPGPREPRDLESFFVPLINEVQENLKNGGQELMFHDGVTRKVRLHLLWFQGDTPAVSKAAGLCGHKARYPCRSCFFKGIYVPSARGYYYPSCVAHFKETGDPITLYDPENLVARSPEMVAEVYERLNLCRTERQRAVVATETGIKRSSLLCAVPNFVPFKSFPHDTMHLFYNIQRELLGLITGDIRDLFALDPLSIEKIDTEICDAGRTISGQLIQRRPQGISKWTSWKASEHRAFFLGLCLIVFDGYQPPEYLDGLFVFVELLNITCRPELSHGETERVGFLSLRFLQHFERYYYKYMEERINLCKSQYHMLLHLEDTIRECGPLYCTSQYAMERSIGYHVNRLNSKTLVSESLSRHALFQDAYRAFYKVTFAQSSKEFDLVSQCGGVRLLGPRQYIKVLGSENERSFKRQLENYFRRKFPDIELDHARCLVDEVTGYTSYSRFQILAGSGTQTVRVGNMGSGILDGGEKNRISSYFAAEMDVEESHADVYYGSLQDVIAFDLTKSTAIANSPHKEWRKRYELCLAGWASGLQKGRQSQVYAPGPADRVFKEMTIEDASVVKRLIGIVEHTIPTERPWNRLESSAATGRSSRSYARRGRRRTYFVDSLLLRDHLLSDKKSIDGVSRELKGFARSSSN